jgi:prevent-host-death family protein
MTMTEVRAKLFAVLSDLENGKEVEITRRGRAVARLSPVRDPHGLMNLFAGIARTNASAEELYSTGEVWNIQSLDYTTKEAVNAQESGPARD